MQPQGIQVTTCVQILLLLEGERPLRIIMLKTLNMQCTFIIFVLSKHVYIGGIVHFFPSTGVRSLKQAPHPALMMFFPVTFLLWIHQCTVAFTFQKICGQMRPRPSRQMV